ncbi:hypothetical protein AB0C74_38760 [Spirillospora sp. NPDC048832]
MSEQEDGWTQAAMWLGLVSAVFGILTFCGITNWNDLRAAIGDDPEACQIAEKARDNFDDASVWVDGGDAARTYSEALTRAADMARDDWLTFQMDGTASKVRTLSRWRTHVPLTGDTDSYVRSLIADYRRSEVPWRERCSEIADD